MVLVIEFIGSLVEPSVGLRLILLASLAPLVQFANTLEAEILKRHRLAVTIRWLTINFARRGGGHVALGAMEIGVVARLAAQWRLTGSQRDERAVPASSPCRCGYNSRA